MEYLRRITVVPILIFLCAAIASAGPLVTTTVVDNGGDSGWDYKFVGSPASIAVGKDDTVHIAYYDASNNAFNYARKEGSTWQVETIDAFGTNRQSVSIAVDRQGAVHILYSADVASLTSETRYAVFNGQWSIQSLATIPSGWYSYGSKILIADDGAIHLLFSGEKLHHAISKDGGWETSTLFDLGISKWRATEKNGSLYLSHGSYGIGERLLIGIYGQETGTWLYRNFDTDLTYTDQTPVAFDSSGNIHVVGYGSGDGLTHIDIRSDLTIDEEVLDYSGGHSGVFNDMVMDKSDTMHIAFSVLDYWPNTILGTWYCYVSTEGGKQFTTIETGQYTAQSIAMDSLGNLHLAYYDQVRGDLKYAQFIYKNTLGKTYAEDSAGVNYWVGELAAGKSKGQVVATLINAVIDPQYAGLPAQDQFLNKVAVCNHTADTITTVPDVNDLSAFVSFISGVTDDAATVTAAKAAVDAF